AVAGGRAVSGVPPLATRADALPGAVYSRLAERLAAFPGETYPFHVGDTFLLPPDGCRTDQVAHDRHPDLNRYTPVPGRPALLDAVAARVARRTGVPTPAEHALIAAGATAGFAVTFGALVAPG